MTQTPWCSHNRPHLTHNSLLLWGSTVSTMWPAEVLLGTCISSGPSQLSLSWLPPHFKETSKNTQSSQGPEPPALGGH